MPGMRCLARLECAGCAGTWYADLPVGHGLYYPSLLDANTGRAYDDVGRTWFTQWLEESFASPDAHELDIDVETIGEVRAPILLNCLDGLYGHALLKLLNAQWYLDHTPDRSLVVIVPSWLRWLVPRGVAEIWTVHASPTRIRGWLSSLDERLQERFSSFANVALSVAFPHPATADFEMERFTGVRPFDPGWWLDVRDPVVTWVWRDDRVWGRNARDQARRVDAVASHLTQLRPDARLQVVGAGSRSNALSRADDMRMRFPIGVDTERAWCAAYALSHIVVGIHGSNMLLPSAHAGSVLELLPADRSGNLGQDILPVTSEPVDTLLRYRFISDRTGPRDVAVRLAAMLTEIPLLRVRMTASFADHSAVESLTTMLPAWHADRG